MNGIFDEKIYLSKMDKSIFSLKKDISTLRTGRANVNMLDTIKVDVYGQIMPINQLATVSVPEARLISIQVWDKSNINLIESYLEHICVNKNLSKNTIKSYREDLFEFSRVWYWFFLLCCLRLKGFLVFLCCAGVVGSWREFWRDENDDWFALSSKVLEIVVLDGLNGTKISKQLF